MAGKKDFFKFIPHRKSSKSAGIKHRYVCQTGVGVYVGVGVGECQWPIVRLVGWVWVQTTSRQQQREEGQNGCVCLLAQFHSVARLAETGRNGWGAQVEWSGVQWRTDRCDFKKPDTTEPSQTKRHPLGEETPAWASGVESTMVMEKEQPGSSSCSVIMTGRDKRSI